MLTRGTDKSGKPAEAEARRGQSADSSPSVPHLVTCLKLCGVASIWPCTCNMQVWHGLDNMCVTATRPGGLEHCYSRLRLRADNSRGIQAVLAVVLGPAVWYFSRGGVLVGREVRGRSAADTDQTGVRYLL